MIYRSEKGTIVRVVRPEFTAKFCKRAPDGRQSVQLAPDTDTTPSHVYFVDKWGVDPCELDGCLTHGEAESLIRRHSDLMTRSM